MTYGTAWSRSNVDNELTALAQLAQSFHDRAVKLNTDINGQGAGTTLLETVGYVPADATAVVALIGQFLQVAQLLDGAQSLPVANNFLNAWGVVQVPGQ